MSSMSEKPIIDDRKTDSWQDALNEIHFLLSIAWFSIISCGIINQITPFNSKTQQGYGQVDFT